ncbi:putative serine/threonine-protein kinase iks1 [Rhizophlyctis rosea]|nr:putative serine/threonine-protein kinase iks1 [Rhizophlyctis rosea]
MTASTIDQVDQAAVTTGTMRAAIFTQYAPPIDISIRTVPKPTIQKPTQLLIRVHAVSTNAADTRILFGDPFLLRAAFGFSKPRKPTILGNDFAGVVECVGEGVRNLKVGDEVYGSIVAGAFAEYVVCDQSVVALKPKNCSFEEAAAMPCAACTALEAVRNTAGVGKGQRVLVNGSSGGVGTFLVQLAKLEGAHVTAVCSGRNGELVKGAGADEVVDYTREDFTANVDRSFDVILDTVMTHPFDQCRRVLVPGGIYVPVGGPGGGFLGSFADSLKASIVSKFMGSHRVGLVITGASTVALDTLRELVESGKINPIVDRRFKFEELPEAVKYQVEGHVRGKSVITIFILKRPASRQVVLYNPEEKRVTVRRLSALPDAPVGETGFCPLCRQPIGGDEESSRQHGSPGVSGNGAGLGHENLYEDAEYFQLLGNTEGQDETEPGPSWEYSRSPPLDEQHTPPHSQRKSPNGQSKEGLNSSSFNQGYYDKFFVEERKLGRGLRGSVFLCQHVLDEVPLGQFAVKAIPVGTSHAWLVRMLKEVHLLERLRHPNIIEYKHAWLENRQPTIFGPPVPCLFILMELANGGNLEEFINVQWMPEDDVASTSPAPADLSHLPPRERAKRLREQARQQRLQGQLGMLSLSSNPRMSERDEYARKYGGIGMGLNGRKVRYLKTMEIWSLFLDICAGLAHLHKHGIIHRDLKPPNLLLHYSDVRDKEEIPRVLISDFGECEVISDAEQRERTGATGTLEFMPPELLARNEAGQFVNDHSPKADMWSLGIVLYFLCFSRVPYVQVDDVDLLKEEILAFQGVTFPESVPRVSNDLITLIERLLQRNARDRPSVEEILEEFGDVRKREQSSMMDISPTDDCVVLRGRRK